MRLFVLSAAAFLALVSPALAHHALGGGTTPFFHMAMISGLAHPIINFEHLAYVVAIGVLAAVGQGSKLLPLWFVGGTVVGTLLALNGLPVPFADWLIMFALVFIGGTLVAGRERLGVFDIALFAITGVIHGSAYAEAIVGNITSSVVGYLLGFAIMQGAIASGAMFGAYALWRGDRLYENARVVGGLVMGVGLVILAQGIQTILFPTVA